MRNDADFIAYVAARWPFLVRSLVLIGCPRPEAEALVQTALARCYEAWDEVLGSDDVDVSVYAVVLDRWHRSARHRPRPAQPLPETVPETVPADELVPDAVRVRRVLEEELGHLEPVDREAVVLRFVAGLSDRQVTDLLGVPAGSVASPAPAEDFRTASESIDVLAPPIGRVLDEAAAQRRRHRRVVLASVVAAVVAVGAIGWLASRPAPGERPSDQAWKVVRQPNPVDVAWYAGGQLHLARVTVEMPPIVQLVAVDDGAVVVGRDGAVVFVAKDGAATDLGRTDPGSTVAASDQTDWVAWVDSTSDVPRVVVHNLVSDKDLATHDVGDGGRLLGLDQARVYYATAEGEFAWEPGKEPQELDRTGLLDVDSGARAYAVPAGIEIMQAVFRASYVRPGTGAVISPGGSFLLSRAGDGTAPFRPILYDVRTGDRMRSGLSAGELALDATFGPNHTMSYLVAPRADLEGGPDIDGNAAPLVVLRTCDLAPVVCHDVLPLARPDELPLLAQ